MSSTERTGGLRAELWVRETLPAPAARQCERLTERLRDLSAAGAVESVAVSRWEKRIERRDPTNTDARDRYLAFRRWADDYGVRLGGFGTRACYSMETGERSDWLVFPALALAVYEDGDAYRSVTDGLTALATDPADEHDPVHVGSAD
jgi:hypothetical protein